MLLVLGPFVSATEPVLISWERLLHTTGGQLAGTLVKYNYVTGDQQ